MTEASDSRRRPYSFTLKSSARKVDRTEVAPLVKDFKEKVLPEIREEQRKKDAGAIKARRQRTD